MTGYPDLTDIMAAGYGLTDALAWWNKMMNAPGHDAEFWWLQLDRHYEQFSQECLKAPDGSTIQ